MKNKQDEHPTEKIKTLNYDIYNLENLIKQQVNILEANKIKLDKLKYQLQSLINYTS